MLISVEKILRILRLNVRENVMIEELQDHRDTIGKDKILTDIFELERPAVKEPSSIGFPYLINMIDFQMLEEQQENRGHCFDDHLLRTDSLLQHKAFKLTDSYFVTVDIEA